MIHLLAVGTLAVLPVFPVQAGAPEGIPEGVLNAAYWIEKQPVQLVLGKAEIPAAPGSAAKIATTVFDRPVLGDLNDDGRDDAALFLVQDAGGSGTFYYVAAAIAQNGKYQGTNAIFLGDRIAPRMIEIRDGLIVARYADRRPDQPMAAVPTIDTTISLMLKGVQLKVIKPHVKD